MIQAILFDKKYFSLAKAENYVKKHGYKPAGKDWIKKSSEELKSERINEKKEKLLDKLLEDKDETI